VGVSPKGTVGVAKTQKHRGTRGPCVARMTSVNVSEGVSELTDGMVRSLNATAGAGEPWRPARGSQIGRGGIGEDDRTEGFTRSIHPRKGVTMTTSRIRLIAIVGVVSGILVSGDLGLLSSVSAQPTRSGIKENTKEAAEKAGAKWGSLSTEKQQELAKKWQMGVDKAQQKWESLPPEQRQQALAQGKATTQRGKKKWQELPAGTPPAAAPAPAPAKQ